MSAVRKESVRGPVVKAKLAYFNNGYLKNSQYFLINLLDIPLDPGADFRFDLLIDSVSSSTVRGESSSSFSFSECECECEC
jgi:hypothetical protein